MQASAIRELPAKVWDRVPVEFNGKSKKKETARLPREFPFLSLLLLAARNVAYKPVSAWAIGVAIRQKPDRQEHPAVSGH